MNEEDLCWGEPDKIARLVEMIARRDDKVPPHTLWLTGWERSNLGPELAKQGAKIVVARSPDVDLDCRSLIKDAMKVVGGSGGGKPDFAQGGGPPASEVQMAAALDQALQWLVTKLIAE